MESEIIRHYYNIKQTDETYQRKLELVDTLYSILANAYPSKLKNTTLPIARKIDIELKFRLKIF